MRARNISTRLCTTRVGSRRSGNTRANLSAKPRRRSAIARSITPPFEVRRPPSKAAVTFLVRTAGNENGRIVSSVMAGVAFAVDGDGVGFATESYAASALYTMLASLSGALWRIRRAKSLFFANEGFGPFALGAPKPGEVRAVFPSFVKDHLHRSPTNRAVRQPLRSQRIKQKVMVGS